MKKYQAYKDSGIEWIGEIPEKWEAKRIKYISLVKRGASPRPIDDPKYFDENGEYAWVRISDVTASERYLTKTTQRLSEIGAKLSVKREPNDFFLSIAGSVGKPMITKIKCCIHDGFVWFPSLNIEPEFLYYIFQTGLPYLGLGKLGTQLNLNTETIGNIFIPFPSKEEIECILKFLDKKTSEIENLINKKKQLIALLKEERTAIINNAVTKGINPNVKFKDSGVAWIGEVPEHWELKKLRFIADIIPSNVDKKFHEGEEEVLLCNYVDVYKNDWITSNIDFMKATASDGQIQKLTLRKNDVIATKDSEDPNDIGVPALVNEDMNGVVCGYHLTVFRTLNIKDFGQFLFWFLKSKMCSQYFSTLARGITRYALGSSAFKNLPIPLPRTNEELLEIVNFLKKKTSEIDIIISKTEKEIELMKEYKTALISEVVTGKIDVRGK